MSQLERQLPQRPSIAQTFLREAEWNEVLASRLILVLALVIGFFLRVWQINQLGYNTDEAVYSGQAAAIAADPTLKELFPIFRAHPLLFQFILAVVYLFGVNDLAGRIISMVIGLLTVIITYRLGRLLFGEFSGALAAMIMAFMPYHVVVTRQVLLDGPMTFFATLTLYQLALFADTGRSRYMYTTGASMGLTFLAKETGIVLIGAIYGFLALSREVRLRLVDLAIGMALMVAIIAPFPLSLQLAGGSSTGKQYLIWQLFRRPNHTWDFYLTTVPQAMGVAVVALAALGVLLFWKHKTWRDKLLLTWIAIPVLFFQLWPTKGFQYLLPAAPAVAILAARVLSSWSPASLFRGRASQLTWMNPALVLLVGVTLFWASWSRVQPSTSKAFLAGTGGVPGGREAGRWIQEYTPEGSTLMTIGPSMANIMQFYGHRRAYGLSVSPNPLYRNPSYTPIINPDLQIRKGEIHYLVWDSFSASRSVQFSDRLLGYARKYNGKIVHMETVKVPDENGETVETPVIIIYEIRS